MKYKIVIFYLLLIWGGQVYVNAQITGGSVEVRSPQSADMIRYGNVPVAKNSGRLDLSIPLLAIEEADFNMPVSIKYNSAGYMPSKSESCVGLDWTLITGGAIYREVRGMPDDWEINQQIPRRSKGFLHVIKDGINYNTDAIFATPSNYIQHEHTYNPLVDPYLPNIFLKNTEGVEAQSDIYNFSFGPYSGKFTINFNGTTNVISTSGGNFKVDLSGYNYFDIERVQTFQSTIRITTDDGYVYSFGGNIDAMEYTISYGIGTISPPHISSFHLYEIKAPNGRKLEIKYAHADKFLLTEFSRNTPYMTGNRHEYLKNFTLGYSSVNYTPNLFRRHEDIESYIIVETTIAEYDYTYHLTKVALIDEVKTDFQALKFHYSSRPNAPYGSTAGDFMSYCGVKLDSVCLKKNDRSIKKTSFRYHVYGSRSRFFLKDVTHPDGSVHTFDYNHSLSFPSPESRDIDYWGFWRNKGVDVTIKQELTDKGVEYKYQRAKEESADIGFDHALLNKITYPTGGCTTIEYEHHDYASKIDMLFGTVYTPMVFNCIRNIQAGGARVKYLKNKVDGKIETKVFYYTTVPTAYNSRSSGIISNYPRYGDQYSIPKLGANASRLSGGTYSIAKEGINMQSQYIDHIAYSKVTEVLLEEEKIVTNRKYEFSSPPLFDNTGQEIVVFDNIVVNTPSYLEDWTFIGALGGDPTAKAYFYIKSSGVILKTIELSGGECIKRIPPMEVGVYQIAMKKFGRYTPSVSIMLPPLEDYAPAEPDVKHEFISPPLLNNTGQEIVIFDNIVVDNASILDSWTFTGSWAGDTTAKAYFYIKSNGIILETIELSGYECVKRFPAMGTGTYQITMKKFGPYIASINISLYHTGIYFWKGPCTVSYFSDYITNPNNNTDDKLIVYNNLYMSDYVKNCSRDEQNRSNERGLLLKEEYYNSDRTRVREDSYIYRSDSIRFNQKYGIHVKALFSLIYQVSKDYFYPYHLTEKEVTEYTPDGKSITSKQQYTYNPDGYLKETRVTTSKDEEMTTKLYYPFEQTDAISQLMTSKNILSPVIREEKYMGTKKLEENRINYIQAPGVPMPVVGSTQKSKGNTGLLETRVKYGNHNLCGNPQSITYDDIRKEVYLWGYKGQYLIAKVEGETYLNIKNKLTQAYIDALANSDDFTIEQDMALRNKLYSSPALNVHVITYGYKPLIGVTRITDPQGITTHYEYDPEGRLKEVYYYENNIAAPTKKRVLQHNQYNYPNH